MSEERGSRKLFLGNLDRDVNTFFSCSYYIKALVNMLHLCGGVL